eukprot:656709-Pyramimonas_sp.AAC.1
MPAAPTLPGLRARNRETMQGLWRAHRGDWLPPAPRPSVQNTGQARVGQAAGLRGNVPTPAGEPDGPRAKQAQY